MGGAAWRSARVDGTSVIRGYAKEVSEGNHTRLSITL